MGIRDFIGGFGDHVARAAEFYGNQVSSLRGNRSAVIPMGSGLGRLVDRNDFHAEVGRTNVEARFNTALGPMEFSVHNNGETFLKVNGHQLQENGISSQERNRIVAQLRSAVSNGTVTDAEINEIKTSVIRSMDPRALAEAQGRGRRFRDGHAEARGVAILNGYVSVDRGNTTHSIDTTGPNAGLASVTRNGRTEIRDENVSAAEMQNIRNQMARAGADGFLSNVEANNIGQLVTNAINSGPEQDGRGRG